VSFFISSIENKFHISSKETKNKWKRKKQKEEDRKSLTLYDINYTQKDVSN
jgi:hypothetical protein